MKTLTLVRHAKSSWDHPGLKDFDRPLNKRGLHDAPLMAEYLKQLQLVPDMIVSSPAKRAILTAQFMAQALLPDASIIQQHESIYEASTQDLLNVIQGVENAVTDLMLVGHNPAISYFVNTYSDKFIDNVPTCGVVVIEFAIDSWADLSEQLPGHLNRFEYPKKFRD